MGSGTLNEDYRCDSLLYGLKLKDVKFGCVLRIQSVAVALH
jgi:hypothetical protein